MKWVHSALVVATLGVGSLAEPRARPAQSSAVPCVCRGHSNATVFSHPCIASTTTGGGVQNGRCHRDPPSSCSLPEKRCSVNLTWTITAKAGCTPDFEVWVNGSKHSDAGRRPVYDSSFKDLLWCGEFDRFVTVTADGVAVLTFIIECDDCNE